jgi:DNA polymerase III delta subunit
MAIEAAEALADSCGDLQEVSNEIDKLILFIGKKPTITFEDIQDHGLPNESADFKDLEEAIYQRNLKMALNQGRLLAEMGVRAEAIFPLFERIFRNLVLAAYKTEVRGWNHKDLFSQFRLRGRTQQENFMRGLTLYSKEELQGSLALIAEADLNLKTGALSSEVAVTLVILNLLGRARRYPLARAAN